MRKSASTFLSSRSAVALVAAGGLLLAACGSDSDEAEPAETSEEASAPAEEEPTDDAPADDVPADDAPAEDSATDAPRLAVVYSAEWFDGSWGEAAFDGATALEESGVVAEAALAENVTPGAEGERALRQFAEEGYNPIIAHSFDFGEDVKKVAPDFPDTIFIYAGGFGDVDANMGDYEQPFYQASYLQGILAAGTVDGNVAGAAGFEIPACYSMYEAFLAGAQEIDPDTEGSFVAVGDWFDVQLAKEAALGQSDGGATMFVGCGQAPTFGQIEAANEQGGVSSGYVGDMSAVGDSVLSSFVWNLDKVFAQAVADVAAGSSEAQYYGVGLADGGLEVIIDDADLDSIDSAALELYETRLAEIQAGTFEVPFVPEAG
ncbi:MAG: BMP family protein [Actinomycetota bacterium]